MTERPIYDPSGVQQEFHLCTADEAMIGGSGGPGKSLCLLMDPIQTQLVSEHERWTRGEIQESEGKAIHFRREFPMLGETLDRAHRIFPKIDSKVHWDGDTRTFRFQCGYKYQFGHMKDANDWRIYDSNQYCVAEGTEVLMGDGSWRAIESITVGEEVMTLEGARPVMGRAKPRITSCVRADVYLGHVYVGTQIHPTTHPFLTSAAGSMRWSSTTCRTARQEQRVFSSWQDYESLLCGRQESPAKRVSLSDAGSEALESCGLPPDGSLLPQLSVPVVLHAPTVRQCLPLPQTATGFRGADTSPALGGQIPSTSVRRRLELQGGPPPSIATLASGDRAQTLQSHGGGAYAQLGRPGVADFQFGCQPDCGSHGEQPLGLTGNVQVDAPSRADAASHSHSDSQQDEQGNAQGCTPPAPAWSYLNFYTRQIRPVDQDVELGTCVLTPCGKRTVHDIEVDGANHYITKCGLVSLNTHVGFDELWQFEYEQYVRVVKRCRTSDTVLRAKKRVRSATIPSGNWVRAYFVDPAPAGRVLLTNTLHLDDGTTEKRTRVFIPALLRDNPDAAFRRDYEANLRDSPPHIRLALLNGDWYVVAGAFFAHEWDPAVHVIEPFKIPSGWERFRAMDWGYKAHGTIGWYAVDTDGDLTKYREYTFQRMSAEQVADRVMEIEDAAGEWDIKKRCSRLSGPADTQIWETRGTIGPTIAETMSEKGVWWEKCTKNRFAATQEFLGRLRDRTGERGKPGFRVFRTCKNTIRTIPARETDPNNPELPKDGGEDHWLDETLYAHMYRAKIPKKDELSGGRKFGDDDGLGDARRKASPRQRAGGSHGYGQF